MTAPPPKKRVADCTRKRRYSDEFAARAGAQIFCQETGQAQIGIYQCDLCSGWHLTRDAARKFRVTATELFLQPSYKGSPCPPRNPPCP